MAWHAIGRPQDLKFDPGAPCRVAGRALAVFPLDGRYAAIDNACPHASAPLCDGSLTDGAIVCMLHLWRFDLRTGACDVGREWDVRTYPVRLRDGVLEVEVEGDAPA